MAEVALQEQLEEDKQLVHSKRERLRAFMRRNIRRRVMFWVLLALPVVVLATAQVWHRLVDTFGSRAVLAVRSLGSADRVPSVESPSFLGAMTAISETPMVPGHHIEILQDGASTIASIERDIQEARRSILIQSYYCTPGQVTDRLKSLLMARARDHLSVLFLRDGFGCEVSDGFMDSLRSAGVEVATMRPLHWYTMHRALHRSHVRSVIIDSRIGYTGGFGFADKWLPGNGEAPWQETAVRFTGPAVGQLSGAFVIAWADATGQVLAGNGMFSAPHPVDSGAVAGVMFVTRTYGTPLPERYLALSIAGARQSIYIANPYFIPNRELRRWLKFAAGRGVDVRVLTASEKIDVKLTRWASRSTYDDLLEGGVRIFEYQPAMLHAKTMVIDGIFGSVGSLNLDNLSLRINDEAVLLAQDSAFSASLQERFLKDLTKSKEITLAEFHRRSLFDRVMTGMTRFIRDFM